MRHPRCGTGPASVVVTVPSRFSTVTLGPMMYSLPGYQGR